jgi:hypothetical protein
MIMDKKFNIKGREVPYYLLSNNDLIDLYQSNTISIEDKEFINEKIISRFEQENCKRYGESNDNVFARQLSNFINGKMESRDATAKLMANDHRYLVQETFKLFLKYMEVLATNYENGCYDGRNNFSCETSYKIIEFLKENKII